MTCSILLCNFFLNFLIFSYPLLFQILSLQYLRISAILISEPKRKMPVIPLPFIARSIKATIRYIWNGSWTENRFRTLTVLQSDVSGKRSASSVSITFGENTPENILAKRRITPVQPIIAPVWLLTVLTCFLMLLSLLSKNQRLKIYPLLSIYKTIFDRSSSSYNSLRLRTGSEKRRRIHVFVLYGR